MPGALERAVRAIADGALVAYPTETLIGLAARADDPSAVRRLVSLKGRAPTQPVSVAVSSGEELEHWALLSPMARRFIRRRLPGPYTVLLRPSPAARAAWGPPIVARGQALGVRVPDHPVARALAERAGPITATSANPHGYPPARRLSEARRYFGRRVAVYLIGGGPAPSGRPSTLVDLRGARPVERPRSR